MPIIGVIVLSSLAACCTDWLFMDVLVHRAYAHAPEIWRRSEGAGRIVVSQILGTAACAAVVVLCTLAPGHTVTVACLAWAAGPLPITVQTLQWIRIAPVVAASWAIGWLVRLLIAAGLAGWLLR